MERSFIEKNSKLQREVEKRIDDIKKKAREDAQAGLDADTRKVISDNKRMSEELRFQLQTTDELQHQGKLLVEENKRLKRDLSLANDKEKQSANRGYYKENELNALKTKLKDLERTFSQTVREFEHEKSQMASKHTRVSSELSLEVAGLRQLVKLKNKELKSILELAEVILKQRTEVEQYFLEALDQVKREIRKQRQERIRESEKEYRKQMRLAQVNQGIKFPSIQPGHGDSSTLGELGASTLGNAFSFQKGVKIELRDLSWQDRERVLRLLFAKINSAENQAIDVLKDAAQHSSHQGLESLTAADIDPVRPSH